MGYFITSFIALMISACAVAEAAPPGPARVIELRPELDKLVSALATFPRVESSHVGFAGAPSASYAAWEAVRKAALEAELLALTEHTSPVVRGYAIQYATRSMLVDEAYRGWLGKALRDTAKVGTMSGCEMAETTIADLALDELCWNATDKAGAQRVVKLVAADATSPVRERAGQCIRK